MKEIDEKTLDTALALGDAICDELGICCEKRGQVIFRVYKKVQWPKESDQLPAHLRIERQFPQPSACVCRPHNPFRLTINTG